jgi:hypothetical protein
MAATRPNPFDANNHVDTGTGDEPPSTNDENEPIDEQQKESQLKVVDKHRYLYIDLRTMMHVDRHGLKCV